MANAKSAKSAKSLPLTHLISEHKEPAPKVRITFVAECEAAAVATTTCTIFGLPGAAEPYLCDEFAAIVAALFGGYPFVTRSTVETV